MQLEYQRNAGLPKLSWIAHVERAQERVLVECGLLVETRDTFFIEGAWNGEFEAGGFSSTECVFGSGAALPDPSSVVFVTSCATTDSLFYAESDQLVLVSNSLALLLAAKGDRLDPDYERYFDYCESIIKGINDCERTVPTCKGNVKRLLFRNLRVQHGSCDEVDKPWPPRFPGYREYIDYLESNYSLVVANARSPKRKTPITVYSTQSRGYDTTAINALASRYGIDRVFTCPHSKSSDPLSERRDLKQQNDDGSEICKVLGLDCIGINRKFYKINDFDQEYLYYASQAGNQDANLLHINSYIEGVVILLTGVLGELWYDEVGYRERPGYVTSDLKRFDVGGHGLSEVRLRIGFVQVPLPYLGARRRDDIYRISNSPEMNPWRVNPNYDRPIPRRIAEERGVPRSFFGQVKMGSVVIFPKPCLPYGRNLRREFLEYLVRNKIVTKYECWLWPLIHRVNMVLEARSPERYRAVYYLERGISRMSQREFAFKQIWSRLNGALFCFCVNKCVDEYAGWIGRRTVAERQELSTVGSK